jgi:hypothetical protein
MKQPTFIHFQDAFKQYLHDQDKIITPEETVARFKQRLVVSGLDILQDIVRIDNGRLGIPVYFSVCGPDARKVIGNTKQMGKGASPAQSQASAVMELGERFSLFSFYQNEDNFIRAPFSAIKSSAIGFDAIARSVSDTSDDLAVTRNIFEAITHAAGPGRTSSMKAEPFWCLSTGSGPSTSSTVPRRAIATRKLSVRESAKLWSGMFPPS